MKLTQRMRYLAFIPLLGILFYVVTSGTASASTLHSISSPHTQTHSISSVSKGTPAWILQAQPYIRVANSVATISPIIHHHLSSSDITKVQQSVNHYNSLPLSLRLHGNSGQLHSTVLSPNNSFRWTINYYWWGIRVWVNSDLAQALAAGASVPAAILVVVPPAALLVVIYAATIFWDNYECGDQGVFFDFPYLPPGSFYPTAVC